MLEVKSNLATLEEMVENNMLNKYSQEFLSDFLIYLKTQEDRKKIVYLKELHRELGLEEAQFTSIIGECNKDKLVIQVHINENGPQLGATKIVLTNKGLLLAEELLYLKYKPKLIRELLCYLRKRKAHKRPVFLKNIVRHLWKDYKKNYMNRRTQATKLINNLKDEHLIKTNYFNYSSYNDSRKEVWLTISGSLLAERIAYDQLTNREVKILKLINSFPTKTRKEIYRNLLTNKEK